MQKQSLEVFYKEDVVKNSAIFAEKHLWWSLFNSEYCKIFKSPNLLEEHLRTAAFQKILKSL